MLSLASCSFISGFAGPEWLLLPLQLRRSLTALLFAWVESLTLDCQLHIPCCFSLTV